MNHRCPCTDSDTNLFGAVCGAHWVNMELSACIRQFRTKIFGRKSRSIVDQNQQSMQMGLDKKLLHNFQNTICQLHRGVILSFQTLQQKVHSIIFKHRDFVVVFPNTIAKGALYHFQTSGLCRGVVQTLFTLTYIIIIFPK